MMILPAGYDGRGKHLNGVIIVGDRSIIGAAYGLQLQFHIFNAPLQSGELLACLQFRVIFYG